MHRGEDEEGGLEALAPHAEEADERDGPRTDVDRAAEAPGEVAGDAACSGAHPEDHRGDEADGDEGGDTGDRLLDALGQLAGAEGEPGRHCHGERDRGPNADPDVPERPTAVGLHEEGHEDDDNEGGLKAFPQADQGVAGEHGPSLGGSVDFR